MSLFAFGLLGSRRTVRLYGIAWFPVSRDDDNNRYIRLRTESPIFPQRCSITRSRFGRLKPHVFHKIKSMFLHRVWYIIFFSMLYIFITTAGFVFFFHFSAAGFKQYLRCFKLHLFLFFIDLSHLVKFINFFFFSKQAYYYSILCFILKHFDLALHYIIIHRSVSRPWLWGGGGVNAQKMLYLRMVIEYNFYYVVRTIFGKPCIEFPTPRPKTYQHNVLPVSQ